MARAENNPDVKLLRKRVSGFLLSKSLRRAPLINLLRRIAEQRLDAVLFGGTLRDLMRYGPRRDPRDVDVVVDGASVEQLALLFSDVLVRRTRFGGLHLNTKGWMIDIWPLSDTWAVRERRAGAGDFEALTRTTFLNVEAVTIELKIGGDRRKLHSSGFFEGHRRQVLDINLEENPFPELAAVRALITAAKLQYSLSRRLASYVIHYAKKTPLEQLVSVQLNHYGTARLDEDRIYFWTETLRGQLATGSEIRVPVTKPIQLALWPEPILGTYAKKNPISNSEGERLPFQVH
jgi:hypothetical protein